MGVLCPNRDMQSDIKYDPKACMSTDAGKTFIGAMVCDAIVRLSSETILCVCYTNHALDQFLEALLDKGITDIVRIGSRSKSARLESYNLGYMLSKANDSGARSTSRPKLSQSQFRRMMTLRDEKTQVKEEVCAAYPAMLTCTLSLCISFCWAKST